MGKKNRGIYLPVIFISIIILINIILIFVDLDPDKIDVSNKLQGFSSEHFFGTDEMGRDYLVRVLYGGRISLIVGVLAMVTSIIIGVIIGLISGYAGGFIDSFFMRTVDVLSAIPWIILVTVFGVVFKRGLISIILVIGFFSWMETARLVRTEVLTLKERDYVKYAKFIGEKNYLIILKHIIINVFPTIITSATSTIAGAIMMESSLSFLGLGVAAPMSSWGSLLQNSQKYLQKAPYMAVIPGILIILTIYSFNKLGNIVKDRMDPMMQRGEINGK
ncbi:ABC transporter permease [Miniphocaeibacter massiliensis]|uniref:ABC transporter permease n=1 Tax=Miniphocaeibacter massiliensis TaxID=2041841 RepID=UPI000C1BBBB5|nr:ABC transporter permease [Miniphocaeibacter massiliensis]